jgi:hypothetical protein
VWFTPRPLYPRVKNPWYQLDSRLDGPQNRPGRRGEEKNLAPTRTRTPNPYCTDCVTPIPFSAYDEDEKSEIPEVLLKAYEFPSVMLHSQGVT